MKKSVLFLVVISLMFLLCFPAFSLQETQQVEVTYRGISISLNGHELIPVDANGNSVEPFILDGTTYLPVRGIANALNLSASWDGASGTVTLESGAQAIEAKEPAKKSTAVESKTATYRDISIVLNGQEIIPLDASGNRVEPFIIDGTTFLPVRAISEALNLSVQWDSVSNTVILTTEPEDLVRCDVLRTIDGDTIVVDYNGTEETVRLIGVNCPEIDTDAGFAASEYTTVRMYSAEVDLELDEDERDQYGRLLAYVYLDGEMFNEDLVSKGYADVATYPPNIKYVDIFEKAQAERHPSVPSNVYYDGYMLAPEIIYTTTAEENGLDAAFMYVEGVVIDIETITAEVYGKYYTGEVYHVKTDVGTVALIDIQQDDWIYVGTTAKFCFEYAGYSGKLQMPSGWYYEFARISSDEIDNGMTDTDQGGDSEPNAPVENQTQQRTVYVTKTGKRYHYNSSCNGGTYYASTLAEAQGSGLTPCNKCVN